MTARWGSIICTALYCTGIIEFGKVISKLKISTLHLMTGCSITQRKGDQLGSSQYPEHGRLPPGLRGGRDADQVRPLLFGVHVQHLHLIIM